MPVNSKLCLNTQVPMSTLNIARGKTEMFIFLPESTLFNCTFYEVQFWYHTAHTEFFKSTDGKNSLMINLPAWKTRQLKRRKHQNYGREPYLLQKHWLRYVSVPKARKREHVVQHCVGKASCKSIQPRRKTNFSLPLLPSYGVRSNWLLKVKVNSAYYTLYTIPGIHCILYQVPVEKRPKKTISHLQQQKHPTEEEN